MSMSMSMHIISFENMINRIDEIRLELKNAECSFKITELMLFNEIVNNKYRKNQIISIGTDFEYRIMRCFVHKMYLNADDTPSYKGIVKAIRVKKGTNNVISGKYDSEAYSIEIYTNRIKQVLREY